VPRPRAPNTAFIVDAEAVRICQLWLALRKGIDKDAAAHKTSICFVEVVCVDMVYQRVGKVPEAWSRALMGGKSSRPHAHRLAIRTPTETIGVL
jgi:hypothetical protein